MTIITPNTLFIGKNYIFLEQCTSTNSYLLDELSNKNIAEGSLLLTNYQKKGRGQMGNTWFSEPNVNLTFSLVLMPKWIKPAEQFQITKLISMSLIQVLNENVKKGFEIKWPNDIYFENKKVAGILIENSLNQNSVLSSVIGIGLNVNQREFDFEKASSLINILGDELNRADLLQNFCERLEANYLRLKRDIKMFDRDYLSNMYRRGEKHQFSSEGYTFEGEIIGVTPIGKIIVKIGEEMKEFGMKEIKFLN